MASRKKKSLRRLWAKRAIFPCLAEGWEDKLFPQLANHLTKDGLIYFESESVLIEHSEFNVLKKRKAGNVFYHLVTLKNNEPI